MYCTARSESLLFKCFASLILSKDCLCGVYLRTSEGRCSRFWEGPKYVIDEIIKKVFRSVERSRTQRFCVGTGRISPLDRHPRGSHSPPTPPAAAGPTSQHGEDIDSPCCGFDDYAIDQLSGNLAEREYVRSHPRAEYVYRVLKQQ